MTHSNSEPQSSDAILGGIEGIQQKLNHPDLALRLEALEQAWRYGNAGRVCLEQALSDRSKTIRRRSRWLLRQPEGTEALVPPPPLWNLPERLENYPGSRGEHVTRFANRAVQEFTAGQSLGNPQQTAYALRCDYDDDENTMDERIEALLGTPGSEQIEALVIGVWGDGEGVCTGESSSQVFVRRMVTLRDRLPNLKAFFLGDIAYDECEISWLIQSDMSPILQAYPQLEVLQVRGGSGLRFLPGESSGGTTQHHGLKALIVETGGLNRETLQQIFGWNFPALEHLELWFGDENYEGDCTETDLAPILDDLKFPNLTYLGLRNSEFADAMMERLVRSPLLAGLQVLDISMGTLTDEGATKLLECEAIRDLEILNVSENYLSGAMIDQLRSLGIQVIADEQREEEEYGRYCVVSE